MAPAARFGRNPVGAIRTISPWTISALPFSGTWYSASTMAFDFLSIGRLAALWLNQCVMLGARAPRCQYRLGNPGNPDWVPSAWGTGHHMARNWSIRRGHGGDFRHCRGAPVPGEARPGPGAPSPLPALWRASP